MDTVTAKEWLEEAVKADKVNNTDQRKYAIGRLMRNYPESPEAIQASELFSVPLPQPNTSPSTGFISAFTVLAWLTMTAGLILILTLSSMAPVGPVEFVYLSVITIFSCIVLFALGSMDRKIHQIHSSIIRKPPSV